MTDEKQSPYTTSSVTMSSNFLQTSGGMSDHRNISSPVSSSYMPGTGYTFGDLGIGSHGSPKSGHEDMDAKEDSKLDLYPDVKGLNLAITLPFQDSDHSSTNTPSQFSQILSFRQSVPTGDAMLSAINSYENDILPESLDVNLAGPLPQLDDGILSNMGAPGDLFDGEGNVNDPYSMDDYSPQTSHDFGGFSSDGYGGIDSDHGLSNQADPSQGLEGLKQQKKPKSHKPAKGQTSPARLGSLQCPTCSKTFTNSSALAKHRLTHSDERKYVCNLCQKAFKRQDHLNGHLMTHREKKPYECTVDNCTKSYCDARSLRRHLENHHNQTPEQIHGAIALVASNAAAVIAAAAATNSAQNKAAQVNVSTTGNTVPIMASSIVSNESSQGSDIKPLSFSSGDSTPVTSPVYGDQPLFPTVQSPAGSMENQIITKQTATAKVRSLSEEESVGQKVQMLLDQAAAASQTNTDETITLHSAQGNQTVTISADNLPQTIAIESSNVLMKHMQPGRQWQDQNVKVNSVQSAHSSSPRSGEPSPGYLQQVSPISPVPNTQLTPSSPVTQPHPQQRSWNTTVSPANVDKNGEEVKPAECTICERTFKNVQALNGHMRCHGGYFKKEPKEDKKTKKNSKEMAPPKSVAPKGNKLIASMPHPSPLDKVGSPQSGQGSAYGSQLQSPVSGDSPVGIDGSAMVLQQFGLDQLQVGEQFWQQIQIHQQQMQGEQLQQQLQQQLKGLQMEQTNVEVKIQQLKDQLQQQNQQLTQKQVRQQMEQTMQQELQLQSALQQQIQQLQLQNTQQLKQQEAQNILLGLTQESHNMKQEHHLQDQKMALPQDTDVSILHNLQHPTGTQLLQAFQHNLAAKQEADRQLYDIQAILKQEAENQVNTQQNRKQPISKEDMEKHLIQRLFLQGGNPSTEVAVSLQQQIEQQKASLPPTSQPQHVNSILLEKMKQKQQQERQQQQMLKTIQQQPYNPGQLPTLIHHHPQVKEETKIDTASVPTSQVPRPLHLQRQVSFEELQNQAQHSIELTSPQQITHQQLQQLLQQRNDTLNSPHSSNNLSDSHGMQHMDLSPPPSLTPTSIQSNLQTAIAQIPLFALKTPTEMGSMGHFNQLPQSKIVTTSAESPDLSLILETIDNDQKTSLSSAKTLPQQSQLNQDNLWTALPNMPKTNHGHLTDARKSTVNYSQIYNDKVPYLDSALHKMGTDPPLYKPEARKLEKAAEQNPFAFPIGNGAQNDFAHPDTIKNPKHHRHKPIANQHTELKRRLSVGSECDLNSSVLPGMINNNNKGYSAKFPSNSAQNMLSVKPRMRSKSGDDFKYFRSKSEDHTFMRPRSQTEECLWKYKQKSEDSWDQALSKSDGAGLFRNPNSLTTPVHLRMKRKHRPAPLFIPRHGSLHGGFQSRLRSPRVLTASEHKGNTPPPYTPPPMLSPIRSGSGLFWTIQKPPMTPMTAPLTPRTSILSMSRNSSIGSAQPDVSKQEIPEDEEPPESDILPHVNIGSQYQAEIPPFNSRKKEALNCISKEDLVFDPEKIKDFSDNEVQYFQEFANSAAIRGNGCNTEYALHLLHLAKGNLQNAMLMLMENIKELPAHHTLLSFTYQENDVWTTEEAEKYLNALLKCDKDFFSVSKEIGSKSVKECIQFYYLWKKVCPDEHKRLRIMRNKRERERLYNLRSQQQQQQPATLPEQPENEMEINDYDEDSSSSTDMEDNSDIMLNNKEDDASSVKSSSSVKSVKTVITPAPASRATSPAPMFTCDYPECNAAFNSKQALNGHIRVHGGGSKSNSPAREYRPPAARLPKPQGSPASSEDLNGEGFPCKLCGRVFAKVRSRSAHMKSHRMNESDKKPVNKKPVPVPMLDNIMPKMSPNG